MEHKHTREITSENEKKTLMVIILTIVTMFAEIVYGYTTHSMGLLADGYHMGTHALAIGLTYIAYILIRKFKDSPRFPDGTEKIGVLAAYTSSLFLGFTGLWIIIEALRRIIHPINIQFNEAIAVAIIGLIINGICVLIMDYKSDKKHDEDYNFKSAYYHILSDALTSVLAIAALLVGKYFSLIIFDSLIGILGGLLILKWATGLIRHTVKILTDMK